MRLGAALLGHGARLAPHRRGVGIDRGANGSAAWVGVVRATAGLPYTRHHDSVRPINGEVRLWVNGVEVTGGKDCQPAAGYPALEAEGAQVSLRHPRDRQLP